MPVAHYDSDTAILLCECRDLNHSLNISVEGFGDGAHVEIYGKMVYDNHDSPFHKRVLKRATDAVRVLFGYPIEAEFEIALNKEDVKELNNMLQRTGG